jgi:CRP/FNR family transcriptional regulator, cyclic AMP receptor protein
MIHPMVKFFSELPLFSGLSVMELNDLLRCIQPVTFSANQTIFRQGDQGDAAYVVQAGKISIYVRHPTHGRVWVTDLFRGEVIGELALLDNAPRSATAVAAEPCELIRIDAAEFSDLRTSLRPAPYKLMRGITLTICERLRETNRRVTAIMDSKPLENTLDSESSDTRGWLKKLLSREKP